jgi:hypothetical protein
MMDSINDRTTPACPREALSTLDYRSLAGPLLRGPRSLAEMVLEAREANLPAGITGAIACHDGKIRQWIEGPDAAVRGLWDRIRQDPRHRVSSVAPLRSIPERQFPGSAMQLALADKALRQVPDGMADLVALTLPCPDTGGTEAEALDRLLANAQRRRSPDWLSAKARHVADLLVALAPQDAGSRVQTELAELALDQLATLVPAVLGDLQRRWMNDTISGAERTIAMALLQGALHPLLDLRERATPLGHAVVCSLPGVPDRHGAMVKAAVLRQAGWSVHLLSPDGIEEVAEQVGLLTPDVLAIVGSRLWTGRAERDLTAELLGRLQTRRPVPVILGGKLASESDAGFQYAPGILACATPGDVARVASMQVPNLSSVRLTRSQCTPAQVYLVDRAFAELQRQIHEFGRQRQGGSQTVGQVIPFQRRPSAG